MFGFKSAQQKRIDELEAGKRELLALLESIWRAEFRKEAPDWQPLPDLPGMVSQLDNMYAGVAGQRDQARWDLNLERGRHTNTREMYAGEISRAERIAGRLKNAHAALRDIVGMVTPGAAFAARKMAARAKEALPSELAPRPVGNCVEQHAAPTH